MFEITVKSSTGNILDTYHFKSEIEANAKYKYLVAQFGADRVDIEQDDDYTEEERIEAREEEIDLAKAWGLDPDVTPYTTEELQLIIESIDCYVHYNHDKRQFFSWQDCEKLLKKLKDTTGRR